MKKLKWWNRYSSWQEAEQAWDTTALEASKKHPLKMLKNLPQMEGIAQETKKNLKWKSFKWMVTQDHEGKVRKGFLKHPFKYSWSFLRSLFNKKSYQRDDDFFLYNVSTLDEFQQKLTAPNSLLLVGFSYCHKPFECPSGRFTDQCVHDLDNPVCKQCFIGKAVHAMPEEHAIPLVIPTIHYIGGKIFEFIEKYPNKEILFIITACELTLEMFGDWGNMVQIAGIGVRLDGRICNTMKAFELSEKGIKPGLTVVLPETQKRILELLHLRSIHEAKV